MCGNNRCENREVRKRLLGFAYGQPLFKSFIQGRLQPLDISFGLVGRPFAGQLRVDFGKLRFHT